VDPPTGVYGTDSLSGDNVALLLRVLYYINDPSLSNGQMQEGGTFGITVEDNIYKRCNQNGLLPSSVGP